MNPRRRIAASLAAATLFLAPAAVAATASAQPAPPPPVADALTPHDVASVPYGWLFDLGIPVYETVEIRPVANLSPPGNEIVLRRLHHAGDGKPGSTRYVFVGKELPEVFSAAENWGRTGLPNGLITYLDPETLDRVDGQSLTMVQVLDGPFGEVRGVGLSMNYLG